MATNNIKTDSGCSLGIRDQRILYLLHRILRLMFGSLWLFFIQTWHLFQNILLQHNTFLLLLGFLTKTVQILTTTATRTVTDTTVKHLRGHGFLLNNTIILFIVSHAFGILIKSIPPCLCISSSTNPSCPWNSEKPPVIWYGYFGTAHYFRQVNLENSMPKKKVNQGCQ